MKTMLLACVLSAVAGCINNPPEPVAVCSTNTWVVTVGMENSNFAGACPGAGIDCTRITKLFGNYTTNIKTFQSNAAVKSVVVSAMKEAASKADLFIFYYSGHGGSDAFWDTKNEADGKDEYLCLFDTYMRDNEIWEICSKAKGRVVMIVDACHSETMFKVPYVSMKGCMKLSATHTDSGIGNRMLVWSGCPDSDYSYGSSSGGKFTNTLLKYFNTSETYESLWLKIEADKDLKEYELVQRTIVGESFCNEKIFK